MQTKLFIFFLTILLAGCANNPAAPILTADVLPTTPTPPREDMMNPIVLKNALTDIDSRPGKRRNLIGTVGIVLIHMLDDVSS